MKTILTQLIQAALDAVLSEANVQPDLSPDIQLERCRNPEHGDFACNIAMMLARLLKQNPRQIAEALVKHMQDQLADTDTAIEHISIAGPGFINFKLKQQQLFSGVSDALLNPSTYGQCNQGQGKKIHLEYVSANPTGPLHVGHGRGAAFGSALANVLNAAGFAVHREYYVNDAGRQMDILAVSVWLRYLACCGVNITFPTNGYKGDYVKVIAEQLLTEKAKAFYIDAKTFDATSLPLDEQADGTGDKEAHIDALIVLAKKHLGATNYDMIHGFGLNAVLADIKDDLKTFGVCFDAWFSEASLTTQHKIEHAIEQLSETDLLYKEKGATWFKSTKFGDDKDRVLIRDNGRTTYFASDAAYLQHKLAAGYHQLCLILGADHHGYVARMNALMHAFGHQPDALKIALVQFAVLYRDGAQVQMSTRSGSFVTLRELYEEVGVDAARYFYVMRKPEQHLDFDLNLAKSQSNDNPVYYIQYAHARICRVFKQADERNLTCPDLTKASTATLSQSLDSEYEIALAKQITRYPDVIAQAAQKYEPHMVAYFLHQLASDFHRYYNALPLLDDDENIRHCRLYLIHAVKIVLANGLAVLGISAPTEMFRS